MQICSGLVLLKKELRQAYNISTITFTTTSSNQACFGSPFARLILQYLLGYDTVVLNWLITQYQGHGFVYNVQRKELVNVHHAATFLASGESWENYVVFKAGVLFTTLFLFFTTTTLVSFTLRETQVGSASENIVMVLVVVGLASASQPAGIDHHLGIFRPLPANDCGGWVVCVGVLAGAYAQVHLYASTLHPKSVTICCFGDHLCSGVSGLCAYHGGDTLLPL